MKIVRTVFFMSCFLLLWQIIIWVNKPSPYLLPPPLDILALVSQQPHLLWHATWITGIEISLGLILGILFGAITALTMNVLPKLGPSLMAILLIGQALPIFAIAPLLVLWLGFGLPSKIIMIALMVFFPVTAAFHDGLVATPLTLLDFAQMNQLSTWETLRYVQIPYAMPKLGAGLKISAVIAPLAAVISEWVGASAGLGYLMLLANARLETTLVFACILILACLSLTLYFSVDFCWKKMIFWETMS